MHIAIAPLAGGLPNDGPLGHAGAVGKQQLKDVPAGFYIQSKGKRIGGAVQLVTGQLVEVFTRKGNAVGKLEPAGNAQGQHIIGLAAFFHQVVMHMGGHELHG